ncbi:MAG: nucleotide sugar dehydrogenase [Bacteroidetes Order II. Incertae sedis bacterium]|nr:nucleotide sugar dehydrogenase [Bacteroidetes Order II. bacterium]
MKHYTHLQEKIVNKTVQVGIVGLGYVGLPLAVEFAKAGVKTLGLDVSEEKVALINKGQNYIGDVKDEELAVAVSSGQLQATTDWSTGSDIDVFVICVPTPMSLHKDPDVTYIEKASEAIAAILRPGQLVILKSTTYPGTTEYVVQPILEKVGLKLGEEYFLAYSPERVDPGNEIWHTGNTPIVVGGVTEACLKLASATLKLFVGHVHEVSSPKVGEMEKLLENTFRSVNIALVNELAQLCDRMGGINIWEVINAAATKPFGYMKFTPGPGVGGHCIPIDPYYLSWLAKRYDFETSFITLAAKTNESMPFYVVDATIRAIAEQPVALKDANVLVMGATFKKDVADSRHSLAEPILRLLREKNVQNITLADPIVDSFSFDWWDGKHETIPTQPLTQALVEKSNVVILITDHSAFDYEMVAIHAKHIVDSRNAFAKIKNRTNITLIGGGQ